MSTDVALLDAWRAGDPRAGAELVDRHVEAIHRFFHNKVTSGADDLIQKTFVACIECRDQFRGDSSFRTWLFGIANNILRSHISAKHGDADSSITSMFDLGPSPSAVLAAKAEERLLLEGLRRIPLDYQIALELYFWEHMTGPEIAVALGVPEGTVRTRLRRGRLALAEAIEALAASPVDAHSTLDRLEVWAASIREQVDSLRQEATDERPDPDT